MYWHSVIFLIFNLFPSISFIFQTKHDVISHEKHYPFHTENKMIQSWFFSAFIFVLSYNIPTFKHSCSNLEQTKTLFHLFYSKKKKKNVFQEIMCSLAWKTIMRVAFLSYDIIKKLSFLSVECKPISSDVISINTFKYSIKVLHSFSCSCEKATKPFKLSKSRRLQLLRTNSWRRMDNIIFGRKTSDSEKNNSENNRLIFKIDISFI